MYKHHNAPYCTVIPGSLSQALIVSITWTSFRQLILTTSTVVEKQQAGYISGGHNIQKKIWDWDKGQRYSGYNE